MWLCYSLPCRQSPAQIRDAKSLRTASFIPTEGQNTGVKERDGWSDLHTKLGAHSNPQILNVSLPTCCSMWTHCWMTEKSVDPHFSLLSSSSQSHSMTYSSKLWHQIRNPTYLPGEVGDPFLPPLFVYLYLTTFQRQMYKYTVLTTVGVAKNAEGRERGGHQHMWMTDWLPLIVLQAAWWGGPACISNCWHV